MVTQDIPPLAPRPLGAINLLGVRTLIDKEISRFMNASLQTVVAPVISTLLFFGMFAFVLGGDSSRGGVTLSFLVPGLVMMALAQNSFMNTAGSLVLSKLQGNIVDVLMPPLSSLELTIGYVVGGAVRGLVVGALCLGALSFFAPVHLSDLFFVLYFSISGSVMLALMGLICGIWAEDFDGLIAVQSFFIMPATILSGTFYTLDSLPEEWRPLCLFNPFFYMIDGFRYGIIGTADSVIPVGMVCLLVVNLVLLAVAYGLFESGYKLKA
ncbi:MAG: ABC transporter permease [Alphaproteobacteria bacterium]|nr:ABC transporter permease [Alphaproteobacteria bacterium]